jgi:hypothetical protein
MAIDTRYTVFWIGAILYHLLAQIEIQGMIETYNQVADENLEDFGPQAGSAGKQLLEDVDQDVTQWCADESSICSHLRDSGREVMAILIAILCNPRCEQFL